MMLERFIRYILLDAKRSALLEASHTSRATPAADVQSVLASLVHKFPQDFRFGTFAASLTALLLGVVALALADSQLFWRRYDTDAAFKKLMLNSYVMHRRVYFDIFNAQALREHLIPQLQDADMLVYFDDALHTIELQKLDVAIKLANNADEFMALVKHVSKKV